MMRNSVWYTALFLINIIVMGCKNGQETKFQQYKSHGEQLYAVHCNNCHQSDGSGLGQLIPPLNNTFAKENIGLSVCAIKYGLEGDITINGVKYAGKMPANTNLTTLEIAEILTYITNSWGQENEIVSSNQVDSLLSMCKNY